jgi:hypothetical protein
MAEQRNSNQAKWGSWTSRTSSLVIASALFLLQVVLQILNGNLRDALNEGIGWLLLLLVGDLIVPVAAYLILRWVAAFVRSTRGK